MGQANWIPDAPHCSVITYFLCSALGSTTLLFLSLSESSFQKQGAKETVDSTAWGLAQQHLYALIVHIDWVLSQSLVGKGNANQDQRNKRY